MRKYSSNLAFVDLLFNLLVGFTSLFVIAFLLINPISQSGQVTPPVRMIVEMTWDDESGQDIDLWFKGPDGKWVYYVRRSNGYATLERDDLGTSSDTYEVNGEKVTVKRNYEVIQVVDLPPGEYVINAHHFSGRGDPLAINIKVTLVSPYGTVYEGTTEPLSPRDEVTLVSFVVGPDGAITDIRTDVQFRARSRQGSEGP